MLKRFEKLIPVSLWKLCLTLLKFYFNAENGDHCGDLTSTKYASIFISFSGINPIMALKF